MTSPSPAHAWAVPGDFEEAAIRILRLEQHVADLTLRERDTGNPEAPDRRGVTPAYHSLEEFVVELSAPTFTRTLGGPSGAWCPRWWDHAEAVLRLHALWTTFEVAKRDPTSGMAVWLAQYVDHHMAVLLSSTGPFGQCRPDEHRPPPPLPVNSAPHGWSRASSPPIEEVLVTEGPEERNE